MEHSSATVVLISGYGRSGSTIIDLELARETSGVSVGELRYAARHFRTAKRLCSCGDLVADCDFWQELAVAGVLETSSIVEHTSLISSLVALVRPKSTRILSLFKQIEHLGGGRTVIVDSSKTTWGSFLRPIIVARALTPEMKVAHLGVYRAPVSVYRSMRKGRNEDLAVGKLDKGSGVALRFALGWVCSNIALHVVHRWFQKRGYPSAVRDLSQLTSNFDVATVLGLDRENGDQEGGALLHMAGGNRLSAAGLDNRLQSVPNHNREDEDRAKTPPLLRGLTDPLHKHLKRLSGR